MDILELKQLLKDEIHEALVNIEGDAWTEIQPLDSVVWEATDAAVSVLIAFERGYRLGSEGG